MRAALYARVSTEEQTEGYSIDAQKRAFQKLCEEKGWIQHHEYIEAGKSAHTDDIRKRPVFKQAIDDALSGGYEVLVVHKIDRFSRKLRITLEYFEKLGKNGIGFVSIQNNIDYSTSTGKFMLVMQGGLAELYSDNLSEETKKGWNERRKQGLYCGALPFGAMKGDNKIPVPDMQLRQIGTNGNITTVRNYEGLLAGFQMSLAGTSDRDIAIALNEKGYRTTGTRGPRPFAKESVRGLLKNRFYIGYIPDGNGGWIKAQHDPMIDAELFEAVQVKRKKDSQSTHKHSSQNKTVYSLTGIIFCWYCKEAGNEGRIHVSCMKNGMPRLGCYNRAKGWGCTQKSGRLDIYEEQIRGYLDTFTIPQDYQKRILQMHSQLNQSYDVENEAGQLKRRLKRLKDLYKWGDIDKAEYQRDKQQIESELGRLAPFQAPVQELERLAEFLGSIVKAWDMATNEQRNKLARTLFQEIWLRDQEVIAVKPQPEFEPFFKLNWEEYCEVMKSKSRPCSNSPSNTCV